MVKTRVMAAMAQIGLKSKTAMVPVNTLKTQIIIKIFNLADLDSRVRRFGTPGVPGIVALSC